MDFNFNKVTMNKIISSGTINYDNPTTQLMKDAIKKYSDYKSLKVNTLLYKISDGLDFIQRNGNLFYTLNKNYTINSIVAVIYVDLNTNIRHSTLLRCINTNNNEFCNISPSGYYEVDDNGNIIFQGNNWNTLYWEDISKIGENKYFMNILDFEFNYSANPNSRDDSQVKSIELFDFSSVPVDQYRYTEFSLNINRYNNVHLNCVVSGNSNKIKLEILTVNNIRNNININSNSIWYENCIFKDIALTGLFFSVDEVNKKVYLHYLGAETINNVSFQIDIFINKGDMDLLMNNVTLSNFIDNNDYVIVPFIKGASNTFDNTSMNVLDFAYQLNNKEKFINGLMYLDNDLVIDEWLYPITRKFEDFKVRNILEKYKYFDSYNNDYRNKQFPNMVGEAEGFIIALENSHYIAQTGPYYRMSRSINGNGAAAYKGDGMTTQGQYTDTAYNGSNNYTGNNYVHYIYKTIDPNNGSVTDWTLHENNLGATDFFNSRPDEPDRLTTASIKTFPYIKLW